MQTDEKKMTDRFLDALAGALCRGTSNATTRSWTVTVAEAGKPNPPSPEPVLTVALQLSGGLSGKLYLSLEENAARSHLFPKAENEAEEPVRAWVALISHASMFLKEKLDQMFESVTVGHGTLTSSLEGQRLADVELCEEQTAQTMTIRVNADAVLVADLSRRSSAGAILTGRDTPGALERVIDVPLMVTLRFGQRQLSLREVLALSTGSLLELDRQVEEPVDLMLGERLIARGEVVIVDGNYGMRVLEVVETTPYRSSPLRNLAEQSAGS